MGTCAECMDGLPRPNNHPDRFKWGGNVAYYKRTDQSGVFGGLVSSRGVDGLLGSRSSQENCAHPDNKGVAAWFYVDLESVHQIHNVTVYNTFNAGGYPRMVDFSIRVGNTSDVDEHAECAYYDGEAVIQGGDVTLDCNARGRYVSFRREGNYRYIDLVTISCETGSFGVGCSEKCDENCKNDLCSADDGRCFDGCELWFVGDKCQDELMYKVHITEEHT
ncbi:hypothetical protein CAPTEDRAFT_204544 [Capitella teleta]|uniref:Fucolectin tachylectin-4 pentraxin-1 domain-containing protein n=1 Tax=Capitella teleta TaxID=283909 RepID=R7UUL2_CAPTE|nr:hypothetical protein CAPTEDRAFT_204544 [Capitella teleta]|eukprot:ELU09863.1 hypothetical protein CAPTEDRAFT_204544 [Capitella teleta]